MRCILGLLIFGNSETGTGRLSYSKSVQVQHALALQRSGPEDALFMKGVASWNLGTPIRERKDAAQLFQKVQVPTCEMLSHNHKDDFQYGNSKYLVVAWVLWTLRL